MGLVVCLIFCAFINQLPAFSTNYFPGDFKFGVGTASYQIEGAWNTDGKGESIWDHFLHKNASGDNGDIASDSYNNWSTDIQLLKEVNVSVYRFSISWSRILPDGTTTNVNQKGVDYYLRILRALQENQIEVMVTLYHWDLPQALEANQNGWLNDSTADTFKNYADFCFQTFGEYVKYWITIYDPHSICLQGYGTGKHAPGHTKIGDEIYECSRVVLLAHAKAYHIYNDRYKSKQNGKVSIALEHVWAEPANSTNDATAVNTENEFTLGWFANPVYLGDWPSVMIDRISERSSKEGLNASRLPQFTKDEVKLINQTFDFFALNIFTDVIVSKINETEIGTSNYYYDKGTKTSVDKNSWPSSIPGLVRAPDSVQKSLIYINGKYIKGGEVWLTGLGWADIGGVVDLDRYEYFGSYLTSIQLAMTNNQVNVTGVTLSNFLDGYEWYGAYNIRFGMIKVHFEYEQKYRVYKHTAYWYEDVITYKCLNPRSVVTQKVDCTS